MILSERPAGLKQVAGRTEQGAWIGRSDEENVNFVLTPHGTVVKSRVAKPNPTLGIKQVFVWVSKLDAQAGLPVRNEPEREKKKKTCWNGRIQDDGRVRGLLEERAEPPTEVLRREGVGAERVRPRGRGRGCGRGRGRRGGDSSSDRRGGRETSSSHRAGPRTSSSRRKKKAR